MNESATPGAETERWLPVAGYEGCYEVSDLGRVRSVLRMVKRSGAAPGLVRTGGRMLKVAARNEAYPYLCVQLWRDGKGRTCAVHILVAEAFLGPRPERHDVCHGPAGKLDNSVANLSYGTHAKNLGPDRRRDGTIPVGSQSGNAKLNEEIVGQCRVRVAAGESVGALAVEFGVSPGAMHKAVDGMTWQHVSVPPRPRKQRKQPPSGNWYGVRISVPIWPERIRQAA